MAVTGAEIRTPGVRYSPYPVLLVLSTRGTEYGASTAVLVLASLGMTTILVVRDNRAETKH